MTALGYLLISGSLYAFFFLRRSAKSQPIATKKLRENPSLKKIWDATRHDVILSLWSSAIFGIAASIMTTAYELGYTRLYLDPAQYSPGYIAFSFVLVLLTQDTYFYFTHRLAHHPKCYRWLHKGHHHSNNPTPLTAFSFDPGEAFLQAFYLMVAVCLIPMHLSVLCAVVFVMTLGALIHHFSLRMFDNSPLGRWLGSWMIGPMHHWFHHRRYNAHYALYFTFWDKLLGTHCHDYESILEPPITDKPNKPLLSIPQQPDTPRPEAQTLSFPVPFKKAS
ncbi:MAG: sterol desaturase family protein [Phormidesmis sp.]